ncbi:hypothetical protein Pelo_11670 [Pelomyxa schiedti]|nr:hypothetical protein Pelo_11670 [Pelomyxa schiedti]
MFEVDTIDLAGAALLGTEASQGFSGPIYLAKGTLTNPENNRRYANAEVLIPVGTGDRTPAEGDELRVLDGFRSPMRCKGKPMLYTITSYVTSLSCSLGVSAQALKEEVNTSGNSLLPCKYRHDCASDEKLESMGILHCKTQQVSGSLASCTSDLGGESQALHKLTGERNHVHSKPQLDMHPQLPCKRRSPLTHDIPPPNPQVPPQSSHPTTTQSVGLPPHSGHTLPPSATTSSMLSSPSCTVAALKVGQRDGSLTARVMAYSGFVTCKGSLQGLLLDQHGCEIRFIVGKEAYDLARIRTLKQGTVYHFRNLIVEKRRYPRQRDGTDVEVHFSQVANTHWEEVANPPPDFAQGHRNWSFLQNKEDYNSWTPEKQADFLGCVLTCEKLKGSETCVYATMGQDGELHYVTVVPWATSISTAISCGSILAIRNIALMADGGTKLSVSPTVSFLYVNPPVPQGDESDGSIEITLGAEAARHATRATSRATRLARDSRKAAHCSHALCLATRHALLASLRLLPPPPAASRSASAPSAPARRAHRDHDQQHQQQPDPMPTAPAATSSATCTTTSTTATAASGSDMETGYGGGLSTSGTGTSVQYGSGAAVEEEEALAVLVSLVPRDLLSVVERACEEIDGGADNANGNEPKRGKAHKGKKGASGIERAAGKVLKWVQKNLSDVFVALWGRACDSEQLDLRDGCQPWVLEYATLAFVMVCKALGLRSRYIAAIAPAPLAGPGEEKSTRKRRGKGNSEERNSSVPEGETKRRRTTRTAKQAPVATTAAAPPLVKEETEMESKSPCKEGSWAEVQCGTHPKSWTKFSIRNGMKCEEEEGSMLFAYVVAITPGENYWLKDVTRRYTTQSTYRGIPLRLKGKGWAWWLSSLTKLSSSTGSQAIQCQENIDEDLWMMEGMNCEDAISMHPFYCAKPFLNRQKTVTIKYSG